MEDEEEISRVLFELSSNRRASILFRLKNGNLKMQQIADSLDMTITETFRHLQRLAEAQLVEKRVDGAYAITSLGNLATGLLSSFNFFLKNSSYFLDHPVSFLPYKFVNRLGELSAGEFFKDAVLVLNRARKMVYEAEEFIWSMAEQVDTSHTPVANEKVSKGVRFKFITPRELAETVKISSEMLLCPHCREEFARDKSKFKERKCGYCERKQVERIGLTLFINEKEACVLLRRTNGQMDYAGFFGTDEKFRNWAQDVFLYYWDKAERWYPNI